jgi:pimeloyl-ACP methyl ester carboxylesterase
MFSPVPNPPAIEERWANISGGRMRYLVGGSGTPLILVHGIAASSFSFRYSWPDLMQDFCVFVPDLLNIQAPFRADLDGCLRSNALRLRDFLDDLGITSADILGSSHGGAVVMELATLAPERFRRMILVSPANPFARRYHRLLNFYLTTLGGFFLRMVPFMPGRVWDYGIGRMYADPKSMAAGTGLGYARPLRTRGAIPYIRSCIRTFAEDVDALCPKLPQLSKIPTLIIWGDRDPVVEIESGYKLQQELGAKLEIMPGIGHLPYEESPGEFNRIVRNFVME